MRRILLLLPLIIALTVCLAHAGNASQAGNAAADRFFALAEKGSPDDVRRFLNAHPGLDRGSITKALHISAMSNSKEVLQLFINAGGDIGYKYSSFEGSEGGEEGDICSSFAATPFSDAASSGKYENASLLLQYGANVNDTACSGSGEVSILHYAAQMGKLDLIKFLMSKGADPKIKDQNNHTPCQEAKNPSNGAIYDKKQVDEMLKMMKYCK